MSAPMFLDTEPGMGIWTRHTTEDGRVFYYNMKRDKSKWEEDFQKETNPQRQDQSKMKSANGNEHANPSANKELGEVMTGVDEKTIEQMTQEVALKERERMIREAKEAKKKQQVVDPTLLQYQEKVKEFLV